MKGEFAFYTGSTRVAATVEDLSEEEIALKLIATRFFVPDHDGGCWLIYSRDSGHGIGVLIGPFRPCPRAARKMRKLPVGIGRVSLALAPILREFGPEALRWDGAEVVAAGQ